MSTPVGHALDNLSRLSPGQRGLTIVITVAPVLTWTTSLPASAAFTPWTLLTTLVLAMLTATRPDSHAGLATVLFLCWYWTTHVITHHGDPTSPWALAAGLSLLVFHAATAARATAPGPADLDKAFWRRWLNRVAVIAVGTSFVWGLTAVAASRHPENEALTVGALTALVGGAAYARWATTRRE